MLKQLQLDLHEALKQLEDLQNWLMEYTTHPDFMTIARDRNVQSVKVAAIEFKISQVEKGLPILGEGFYSPETANTQSQLTNGFKSQN